MFLFLSKLLPELVYPLGLVTLLLAASLLLRNRPRWRNGLTLAALLLLLVAGNRLVAMSAATSLEGRYPPLPEGVTGDVIVVLGGATRHQSPPRPMHEQNEAGDRVLYAATLYHAGVAPLLLLTGGNSPYTSPGGIPEAEAMAAQLVTMGVPREALLLESESRNTWENGVNSLPMLKANGLDEVILVTSAMHMPRSAAIFRRLGITFTPAPTDFLVTEADWDFYTDPLLERQIFNLLPNDDELLTTTRAMREWIGIAVYRLRGWL